MHQSRSERRRVQRAKRCHPAHIRPKTSSTRRIGGQPFPHRHHPLVRRIECALLLRERFPFFGARRGKAAVLEVIRQIADNIRVHRFDRESMMLGADTAASMMRYSLTMLDANKPISLRLAQFAHFNAGKLVSIRILVDTFDLVEQALGHPIHLPRIA